MYELKGVPQPPKRTALGALRRKRGRARAEARKDVLGTRAARAVRVGRGIRRAGRGSGTSLFAKMFRKIVSKIGLRPPSIRSMFRKKSVGDGRNHGTTGIKKRNGRTGFAGR